MPFLNLDLDYFDHPKGSLMKVFWQNRRPHMEILIAEYDAGLRPTERMTANKYKRKIRLMDAQEKGTHKKEEWIALKAEFKFHCAQCLRNCQNKLGDFLDKDHIIPLYKGGSDSIENIQPLCPPCNASKGPDTFNWKS